MYFDPLSAWLVALIADGIMIAEEKCSGGTIDEYHRKIVMQGNESLNGEIRAIKRMYSLNQAELAFNQIKQKIHLIKNSYFFKSANGQIVIDLDNQEYIISLLEECAKKYDKYYKEYKKEEKRQKAVWFKNAAIEARRIKEQYALKLEEIRIKEAEEKEKQKILMVVGIVIIAIFLIYLFS